MIGKRLFFLENNQIKTSKIVATYLKETEKQEEIMLVSKDNVVIPKKEAAFTMQELFSKLSQQYRKSQNKE